MKCNYKLIKLLMINKYKLSSLFLLISIFFISCNLENNNSDHDTDKKNKSDFDKVFEGKISDKNGVLSVKEFYYEYGIDDKTQIVSYLSDKGFCDDKIIQGIWLIADNLRQIKMVFSEYEIQPDSFKIEGNMYSFYKDKLGYSDDEINILKNYSIKIFKGSPFFRDYKK